MDRKPTNPFKCVLSRSQLADRDFVKEYLAYSFKSRRRQKSHLVYINLALIFEHYPNIIKQILRNINTIGYYKDYFYLLAHVKNQELEDFIYDLIVNQLRLDIIAIESDQVPSTLGKWLPREKSPLAIETGFIAKFMERIDHNLKANLRYQHYRRLKTYFSHHLSVIEVAMSSRQYDQIDYDNASPYVLTKLMPKLEKKSECEEPLISHLWNKYSEESLMKIIQKSLSENLSTFKKNIIESLWRDQTFIDRKIAEIPLLAENISNSICVLDLSNHTHATQGEFTALGIAMLVLLRSSYDKISKVWCQGEFVDVSKEESIINQIKIFYEYIGPSGSLDHRRILSGMNYPHTMIYITNVAIPRVTQCDTDIIAYRPERSSVKIDVYRRNNHRQYSNLTINSKPERIISKILRKSPELNDFDTPIKVILFVAFLFLLIKCSN